MSPDALLIAVLIAPVAGASVLVLLHGRPNLRDGTSLLAAAALVVLVATLLSSVGDGVGVEFELIEFLPGIAVAFHAEPLGVGFALIVVSLWFVTTLYSIGYMRAHRERKQTRFYCFFALAIAAALGGAFSANLLTLYLFYELLTLLTWPLVVHGGEPKDRAGGRSYLMLLLATSLTFLLLALVWTFSLTGTLEFRPGGVFDAVPAASLTPGVVGVLFALFVLGTGKAALMPFHRWLPAAMVAPTPVSALLHAVAVVKLGVFAILKVSVYTFGFDILVAFDATKAMQILAAVTLVFAAVIALREDNLKRRLAYSTVSQLGYIVLAATLANGSSLVAGGMLVLVHAFAKITLFFCAGMILITLHKTRVSELRGIGHRMPITLGAWAAASLCVVGVPFTGGFWGKWFLVGGILDAAEPLLLVVVLLGSLLAAGYLLPPVVLAFSSVEGPVERKVLERSLEAPALALVATVVTATSAMLLFFAVDPIVTFLDQIRY